MKKILTVLFFIFLFTFPVQATITDLADVGGKGYFYDSATGYTWMDVDNFYYMNYYQVEAAISGTDYKLLHLLNLISFTRLHISLNGVHGIRLWEDQLAGS